MNSPACKAPAGNKRHTPQIAELRAMVREKARYFLLGP